MGYELKMKVGWLGMTSPEMKRREEPVLEKGETEAWYPHVKDAKDNYVPTGRMERYFLQSAMIDLGKIYDSEIYKLAMKAKVKENAKPRTVISYMGGYGPYKCEDGYGDMFRPLSLDACIRALEKDVLVSDYHRFEWALALLKSMRETSGCNVVLFEGH